MRKILYKGPLDKLVYSGVSGDAKTLLDIYTRRKREVIENGPLTEEKEAKYQEEIDRLLYPKGKPVKKKARVR